MGRFLHTTITLFSVCYTFALLGEEVSPPAEKSLEIPTEKAVTPLVEMKEEGITAKTEKPHTKDSKPCNVKVKDFKLKVSKEQALMITEIVTTLGNTSVIGLGFKKAHLKALGKRLDGIGSLHFLGYISTQDSLKRLIPKIKKSSMKWGGFVGGVKKDLNKKASNQELFALLPSFSKAVNADPTMLEKKAKNRDWDGFVMCLMKN